MRQAVTRTHRHPNPLVAGLLLAQAPCAEAKRRRPRAGSSKFKNPVCPSVQRAYCKSTACPKWCSGQETDTARKQCEAACNPCCNAVKPSQKVILLGGDDYVTYDLTNDCFLDNSMAPQVCKLGVRMNACGCEGVLRVAADGCAAPCLCVPLASPAAPASRPRAGQARAAEAPQVPALERTLIASCPPAIPSSVQELPSQVQGVHLEG